MAAATDEHLLNQIDQACAHGSWRAWSKLLLCLATDNGYTAPLDYDTAATAILTITITGTRPPLHPAGPPARRPSPGTRR
jgi:hypothetical protein